ncbi:glycosyltransferase [Roseospira navarrensis]|nr:glycosyltransferase [Roseospira navarrensis]
MIPSPTPRVLHLAQSDSEGGANRAALRLHRALLAAGMDSRFAAGRRRLDAPDIVAAGPSLRRTDLAAYANAATVKPFRGRGGAPGLITPAALGYGRLGPDLLDAADVVCLHWIAGAFLAPRQLRALRGKPLVWRLSDLWPFTGGCHYPGDCHGYERACGACPMLGSRWAWDITRHGWRTRARAYRALDITVAAPSRWIAACARASSLFRDRRIEVIPTGIDLSRYRPRDRREARAALGLPPDRDLILFGALASTDDPRKGCAELMAALDRFADRPEAASATLVVFGNRPGAPVPGGDRLPLIALGHISDEDRLATLYAAADVLVAPFLEDNLPNVALEALAAGTPVAAFDIGGMPDIVDDGVCGRLVPARDAEALAGAIAWILDAGRRGDAVRRAARAKAEQRFDIAACAHQYRALFSQVVQTA